MIRTLIKSLTLAGMLLLPAGASAASSETVYDYDPTDEIFSNPERGLFHHLEFHSSDNFEISPGYLRNARNIEGMTLMFCAFVMEDYRDGRDIPDAYLERIRRNLQTLRDEGFKVVLRFSYSYSENDYPRDVPWYACQRHIDQLEPILRDYSDIIAVLEAGFVGAWGEWYYTDNYIFNPTFADYGPRKELLTRLLRALPETRFVSVRYPAAKLGVFQLGAPQVLTAATAHTGSDVARVGFHNDCFLADGDDVGTFGGNQHYRQYWKAESKFVPMGGETCAEPNDYTEMNHALAAFSDYHWSYLNKDYHPAVIQEWTDNYFLATIRRNLGYRLQLNEAAHSNDPMPGGEMTLRLKIENTGWAAPFNPRAVEVVFVGAGGEYAYQLDCDPRFWLAGEVSEVNATLRLDPEMLPGDYAVYLNLPDPEPTLRNDRRYSIRLANRGIWDAARGRNKLFDLTVAPTSAIPELTAPTPDSPAYDLLGRRVTSPAAGIVLVKRGNKVTKTILR